MNKIEFNETNINFVESFLETWKYELANMNEYAVVVQEEYISNILELKNPTNDDIFYIMSRLVLCKQNLDDDLTDCMTWCDMMLVDLATSVVHLCDR